MNVPMFVRWLTVIIISSSTTTTTRDNYDIIMIMMIIAGRPPLMLHARGPQTSRHAANSPGLTAYRAKLPS